MTLDKWLALCPLRFGSCLYVTASFETTSVSLVVDIEAASQPAVTIAYYPMSPNKGKKLSVALPSSVC